MKEYLKVTYYDYHERKRTIIAKQVKQVMSMGFPYFEITMRKKVFYIKPLDLICIKCAVIKETENELLRL